MPWRHLHHRLNTLTHLSCSPAMSWSRWGGKRSALSASWSRFCSWNSRPFLLQPGLSTGRAQSDLLPRTRHRHPQMERPQPQVCLWVFPRVHQGYTCWSNCQMLDFPLLCGFLCLMSSKIWPVSKPRSPWQWLPNLVQAQLPSGRDSAFLLLRGLRAHWWGHHQLCSRSPFSVEQPAALLQRWRLWFLYVAELLWQGNDITHMCLYLASCIHTVAYEELLDDHKLEGDLGDLLLSLACLKHKCGSI